MGHLSVLNDPVVFATITLLAARRAHSSSHASFTASWHSNARASIRLCKSIEWSGPSSPSDRACPAEAWPLLNNDSNNNDKKRACRRRGKNRHTRLHALQRMPVAGTCRWRRPAVLRLGPREKPARKAIGFMTLGTAVLNPGLVRSFSRFWNRPFPR